MSKNNGSAFGFYVLVHFFVVLFKTAKVKLPNKVHVFLSTLGSLFNKQQWQQECHKTMGLMSQNNTLHMRFTFWYISLPSSAKQQHEMAKF